MIYNISDGYTVDCGEVTHYRGAAYSGVPFVVLEEANSICTDASNQHSYMKIYLAGIVLNAAFGLLIGLKVLSKLGKERVHS